MLSLKRAAWSQRTQGRKGMGWLDDDKGMGWLDDDKGTGWLYDDKGMGWLDDDKGMERCPRKGKSGTEWGGGGGD